jgi:hypothetical protein
MKVPNRDMLVLVKDEFLSDDSIQHELEKINRLLVSFETSENLCAAHEVFDLNSYKKVTKIFKLQQILNTEELKPFMFIINKN